MGCDIHTYVEIYNHDLSKWVLFENEVFPLDSFGREYDKKDFNSHPFDWRSYSLFGFLADVRNYSEVEPIARYRGLPTDLSDGLRALYGPDPEDGYDAFYSGNHSHTYVLASELLAINYDEELIDKRGVIGEFYTDEGVIVGRKTTYRAFLGQRFMSDLAILGSLAENKEDIRVVMWFDN